MNKFTKFLEYIGPIVLSGFVSDLCHAQIVGDPTVGSQVQTSDSLNFLITGGTVAGPNLLHSFEQLSIPQGGSVEFANPDNLQTIISRVTGDIASQIDGELRVEGIANFFLLNPGGIHFGSDASLNLNGSFIASTASTVDFADGSSWRMSDRSPPVLLSASLPIGLKFGADPQSIIVRARSQRLTVAEGNTLALVSKGIQIVEGNLFVPGGRVDLGSIAENSQVNLQVDSTRVSLSYTEVSASEFQDISLTDQAVIFVTGLQDNVIQIRSRNLEFSNRSGLFIFGGLVDINASESIKILNLSGIRTQPLPGTPTNIRIKTKRLFQDNFSVISINNFNLVGTNQNIENVIHVEAFESVELVNASQIASQTFGMEDAGNIEITTPKLILLDGGQVTSTTFGSGNSGTIDITATDLIRAEGLQSGGEDNIFLSGILARTSGQFGGESVTGTAGAIQVNTNNLVLKDSARIAVAAEEGSRGAAGNLTINARESIQLTNQAQINANTSTGNGGNIFLQTQDLRLLDNSQIITNAEDEATGGNISIDTGLLLASGNSDITANADQGLGGRVTIDTTGLFLSQDSNITATSQRGPELDGVVDLNVELDPSQGLVTLPKQRITPNLFQGCYTRGQSNRNNFVITGKGGIAANPEEFRDYQVWQDPQSALSVLESSVGEESISNGPKISTDAVVEAQTWRMNFQGDIMLIGHALIENSKNPGRLHGCYSL